MTDSNSDSEQPTGTDRPDASEIEPDRFGDADTVADPTTDDTVADPTTGDASDDLTDDTVVDPDEAATSAPGSGPGAPPSPDGTSTADPGSGPGAPEP